VYTATCKASGEAVAIKLVDRGSRANARVLRSELLNNRRLAGHPTSSASRCGASRGSGS